MRLNLPGSLHAVKRREARRFREEQTARSHQNTDNFGSELDKISPETPSIRPIVISSIGQQGPTTIINFGDDPGLLRSIKTVRFPIFRPKGNAGQNELRLPGSPSPSG